MRKRTKKGWHRVIKKVGLNTTRRDEWCDECQGYTFKELIEDFDDEGGLPQVVLCLEHKRKYDLIW